MNLKDDALRGDRVTMFAQLAGINRAEALGRLALLWDHCVKHELTGEVGDRQIQAFLGVPSAVLVDAQLAECVGDGARIKGVKEEVERKRQRTEHARRAGLASAELRAPSQTPQLGANPGATPSQLTVNSESTRKSLSDLHSGDLIRLFPEPSSESPEDLKQQGKSQKRKQRLPETEIPEGFGATEAHTQFAQQNRLDLADELARFTDHHRARGSLFRDWHAALFTWLRNAVKYRKPVGGRTHGSAAAFDLAMEAEERERARRTP